MSMSSKIKVAVLRGGPSSEYDVSLKTGAHILSTLQEMSETCEPLDIYISREGEWHREGLVHEPHHALKHVDVVWNALHGQYGEDGQVQKILEFLKIPFTGSGTVASALAMNKDMAKRLYIQHSLKTPQHDLVTREDLEGGKLVFIFQRYLSPIVVKPANGGSSIGVRLVYNFSELQEAVKETLESSGRVLVEEFIKGREITCGVLDDFQGEKHYALVPIEIEKPDHKSFFDYESKYDGKTLEICPANITAKERQQIEDMAREAHRVLGLRHYSRSDFMLTPKGNIYILETNSLPGLTAESLLPKSLQAIKLETRDFVNHILELAL